MDMFHVFLPSNSPVDGNLTGNYTVRLPNTIDLSDGDWSVALSSIIYPVSYASGEKEEMQIKYEYYDKNNTPKKFNFTSNTIFTSIDHLQNVVNNLVVSNKKRVVRETIQETKQQKFQDTQQFKDDQQKEKRQASDSTKPDSNKLNTAKKEVLERSYKIVSSLAHEIDEKITNVEALAARIGQVSKMINLKAKPHDDFTIQETSDFQNYALQKSEKASQIRNEAQQQRAWIAENQRVYSNLMSEINEKVKETNLTAAKRVADEAKKIANNMKELELITLEKIKLLERIWDEIIDKDDELNEILKPVDTGLKNNIARIKKHILDTLTSEQQNALEIYFYFDKNQGRFFLYNHKPTSIKSVHITPRLAYILGFDVDNRSNQIKRIRMRQGGGFAKYTPDISSGIHQLYVYSPGLIESSFVGNIQAPLLRIVNVDKPANTIAESIYTNMYFMKVIEKRISEIKIVIKDSFNDILRFNWGNVIVTLSFRKSLF